MFGSTRAWKRRVTVADLQEQLRLLLKIREMVGEARRRAQRLDEIIKRLNSQNDVPGQDSKLRSRPRPAHHRAGPIPAADAD